MKPLNNLVKKTKSKFCLRGLISNMCASQVNDSTLMSETLAPIDVEKARTVKSHTSSNQTSRSHHIVVLNDPNVTVTPSQYPMMWITPDSRKPAQFTSTMIEDQTTLIGDQDSDYPLECSTITQFNTQLSQTLIECELDEVTIEQSNVDHESITLVVKDASSWQLPQLQLPAQHQSDLQFSQTQQFQFSDTFAESFGFKSNEFITADSKLFQSVQEFNEIFV